MMIELTPEELDALLMMISAMRVVLQTRQQDVIPPLLSAERKLFDQQQSEFFGGRSHDLVTEANRIISVAKVMPPEARVPGMVVASIFDAEAWDDFAAAVRELEL